MIRRIVARFRTVAPPISAVVAVLIVFGLCQRSSGRFWPETRSRRRPARGAVC